MVCGKKKQVYDTSITRWQRRNKTRNEVQKEQRKPFQTKTRNNTSIRTVSFICVTKKQKRMTVKQRNK